MRIKCNKKKFLIDKNVLFVEKPDGKNKKYIVYLFY